MRGLRRSAPLAFAVTLLSAVPALAQAIDLATPHGNELGCANQDLKTLPEGMLLVTGERLVTTAVNCTFVQRLTAPDGTLVLTTLCDLEEDDARSISFFSIARSKTNPEALTVSDEYGSQLDEVVPCR